MEAVQAHSKFNYQQADQLAADNDRTFNLVLTVAITLMVLAVVLTSVLATLLYRNISNGLSHIENTIEQVSRQQDFRLRAKATARMKSAVPPAPSTAAGKPATGHAPAGRWFAPGKACGAGAVTNRR
jgi:hypothetical protein